MLFLMISISISIRAFDAIKINYCLLKAFMLLFFFNYPAVPAKIRYNMFLLSFKCAITSASNDCKNFVQHGELLFWHVYFNSKQSFLLFYECYKNPQLSADFFFPSWKLNSLLKYPNLYHHKSKVS